MTEEDFTALEARLTAVPAGFSRDLHDVLDLLAECRRLRRPPDTSGLMLAARLAAVRESFARHVYPRPDEVAALFAHLDALESLIRELYGVIADLHAEDPGRQALLERGRAEGRAAALSLLESFFGTHDDQYPQIVQLFGLVRALGPRRPPPPPHESEAEAGRLREALRGCVGEMDGTGLYGDGWDRCLDAARKALGDAP